MECPEAVRLFELYQEALIAFHASRLRLSDAADYESSFTKLSRVRSDYLKHVKLHVCRVAEISAEPDGMEEWLEAEMERAWIATRYASEEYNRLFSIAADTGCISDGILAREQATRLRDEARQNYRAALKRFADYVICGKVPADIRKWTSPTPAEEIKD